MNMNSVTMQSKKTYISPFSITHEAELKWKTMTGKEQPNRNGMINVPDNLMDLIDHLAIVGVIGSSQCKRIYVRSDTGKRISKAIDLGLLKQHELIRKNQSIPLYTLGPTGMVLAGLDHNRVANYWKVYKKHDVMQRLTFFQLYGQLKELDKTHVIHGEEPFTAAIRIRDLEFNILVLRGNESIVKNYFKYEAQADKRIIIIAESLNHILPIQNEIKPFLKNIRLTTDDRLKLPFNEMFYEFKDNNWVLENRS